MRNKRDGEDGKLYELVSDRGDRCPFLLLVGRHLGLIIFLVPPSPAELIVMGKSNTGNYYNKFFPLQNYRSTERRGIVRTVWQHS